ncbi:MAG: CRISPR system precrRNA processing endoribonuclease RAMP protein Cas6 [Synergistaceae bacterium]|nr:CRISPR system precrRNA processing endoribonuclease RAMP protein Cas6 [Synergistaceae bacterium]
MQSYVLEFAAQEETTLPASNGYLLFSMFCTMVRSGPLDEVFHSGEGNFYKSVSIGFLKKNPLAKFTTEDLRFVPGETCYTRVSFVDDTDGNQFAELLSQKRKKTVRVGKTLLSLSRFFAPGEHQLSLSLLPGQVIGIPSSSMGFRFLSPTGFKKDDRQFFLPLPELVFGSLLRKYRLLVDPDFCPALEAIFPQVEIHSYHLASHASKLRSNRILRGFCGETAYSFQNLSDTESAILSMLATFGFFTGVGYKTTQGMGEVVPFWQESAGS